MYICHWDPIVTGPLGYVANEMLDSLPLGETQNFLKRKL